MIHPSEAGIVPFFKKLLQGLRPLAKKKNIKFEFSFTEKGIGPLYAESELLTPFTKLLAAIIDYMPDSNTIFVDADVIEKGAASYLSVKIKNTGINLKMVTAIINNSSLPVTLYSSAAKETTFEVCYACSSSVNAAIPKNGILNRPLWNYTSVVNGIKSHFAKLNNPVARLAATKPKEAAFLTNINNCILKNLSNEQFDANALSNAMAVSRAQLLRRLKSLTGNSPGYYIKTMRLEKAKELLENADVSVSEAAFQTGFNSPSNFTKVFTEKYGITPSQFRRQKPNATNE